MDTTDEILDIRRHNRDMRDLDREHGKAALDAHRFRMALFAAKAIMYACIGIAALIYSTSAHAAQVAFLENAAGGKIYLTDVQSTADHCDNAYVAYSTSPEGKMMFDCWMADGEVILVRWSDGAVSGYAFSQFQIMRAKRDLDS